MPWVTTAPAAIIAPFSNVSLVKHSGIHSDECPFSNCRSVNDGTMSHRYIILQDARHRTGLMDAGAILYIHSVSTSDGIHVRAQYRTIPDAAVITKDTVAGQHCVLSDKTILSPTGSFSLYSLYNSHIKYVYVLQFGCKGNKNIEIIRSILQKKGCNPRKDGLQPFIPYYI